MSKQKVYKLEGKTPDEVKASFIYYMGDKNAVSKQINNAANSRYAKIDTIETICSLVKTLFKVDNIFELTEVGQIVKVSDALTDIINNSSGDVKELKNRRSYVNKYRDFLRYCADQKEEVADASADPL